MLTKRAGDRFHFLTDYLQKNKTKLVIDGDTHPTDLSRLTGEILTNYRATENYYQGRPMSEKDLLIEMDNAGVDMSLIWQNPAAIEYTENHSENEKKLLNANLDIARFADRHPNRFIPGGWTDPKALGVEGAIRIVEACVNELGFPIVKMNPAQNQFDIASQEVMIVLEKIISLGATPAFHFGGDTAFTSVAGLRMIAERFKESRIIAVHMGGGGSHYVDGDLQYIETRRLGLEKENIFYILSAIRDCHIESNLISYTLAGTPFNKNIACGSDAPYGKQSWNFGGFQMMFKTLKNGATHPDSRLQKSPNIFSPDIIQGYLGSNFADLVISACENVLKKNYNYAL